jgi:phenylalanine-4-hydroxylase
MNKEYADLMQLIGMGAANASDEELIAWSRVYWFAVEFGLIVENDELKVFGAGLLSSVGEMAYCYSDQVEHRPFVMEDVMQTDYDPTLMQKTLFYIPSFEFLKGEIKKRLK